MPSERKEGRNEVGKKEKEKKQREERKKKILTENCDH